MKYLSDEIKRKIIYAEQGTVVLLKSPVGSGKTTFCLKELWLHCRTHGKRVLLIVNRSALRGQLRAEIFSELGEADSMPEDLGLLEFEGLTVVSYQILQKLGNHFGLSSRTIIGSTEASGFDYIFADEIHYLLMDSMFSAETHSLLKLPSAFPRAVRIYVSATLGPVRPLLLEMEGIVDLYENCMNPAEKVWIPMRYLEARPLIRSLVYNGQNVERKVYEPEGIHADFAYFMPVFYAEDEKIGDYVLREFQTGKVKKWLIFVESKLEGNTMKKELQAAGISCAFVTADRLESSEQEALESILRTGKFQEQVLIATTVIDNGVSLTDPEIGNIVIAGYEEIEAVQQAGRVRIRDSSSQIRLWICRHTAQYFNKKAYVLRQRRALLNSFQRANDKAKISLLLDNDFGFLNNFAQRSTTGAVQVNKLGIKALEYFEKELEDNLQRAKGNGDGYIRKVLSWFDMDEKVVKFHQEQREINAKKNFRNFICPYIEQTLGGEDWDAFRRRVKDLYEQGFGEKLCSGKKARLPGINKVREIVGKYGFTIIKVKGGYQIKEEQEDVISI